MLKVVGASWLQTRISTYILVAVFLLGIGAIIIGEFGHTVENDGTYAATVTWKHSGGYRIDFWGQGNDLEAIPTGVARAYYRTGIYHSGWSIIEIESSAEYPDTVQAYAAGLLEGSLTWQLIHHHWHNTIKTPCAERKSICDKIRNHLRENSEYNRERADILATDEPYWHMVRLFYAQLDGMEAGWRFAVRRSRQSVEIEPEDFLWLAMASDLPFVEHPINESEINAALSGSAFVRLFNKSNGDPVITLAHNTAAPFAKMLRLLKRYDLAYHVSPSKGSKPVPGQSIVMSSYPGSLSSQDEYYAIQSEGRELAVAGTPLTIEELGTRGRGHSKDQLTLAARVMAANRLATDGRSWSRLMVPYSGGTVSRQWLAVDPRLNSVWLVEQLPGITHAVDFSKEFLNLGYIACTGVPMFNEIRMAVGPTRDAASIKSAEISKRQANLTSPDQVADLMRGRAPKFGDREDNSTVVFGTEYTAVIAFRGDMNPKPVPVGVIDTKVIVGGLDGFETFEATSGPSFLDKIPAFNWSRTFPSIPHCGQPEVFDFGTVVPKWVWA